MKEKKIFALQNKRKQIMQKTIFLENVCSLKHDEFHISMFALKVFSNASDQIDMRRKMKNETTIDIIEKCQREE